MEEDIPTPAPSVDTSGLEDGEAAANDGNGEGDDDGLSTAAIVGITVGALFVVGGGVANNLLRRDE